VRNVMKILPLGAELYHADCRRDGRTDGRDKANSQFWKFYASALNQPKQISVIKSLIF
jgi:hypothetical protein